VNITQLRNRTAAVIAIASIATAAVSTLGSTAGATLAQATTTTTTTAPPNPPTTLGPQYAIRSVESGWDHTCALRADGIVACWGAGSHGRLGNGGTAKQTAAVVVRGLSGVRQLASGSHSTCALTWNREVFCWGRNNRGQLGDGTTTDRTTPVKLALSGVSLLAVGNNHACAASGSTLRCWGANESGQLGTNDTQDRTAPVVVGLGDRDFVALGAFNTSTCGQTASGLTACSGSNLGMFGNGSLAGSTSFKTVPTLSAGTDPTVVEGSTHRCHAESTTGQVRCVGSNGNGGLGDGTNLTRTTPVSPPGVFSMATSGYSNVSCGFERVARQYRCWGSNISGQVGDGTTTSRTTPVAVRGIPTMNQTTGSVSAGRNHACAVYDPGAYLPDQVYCWGSDNTGQLGNGAGGSSTTAVLVQGL